VNGGIKMIFQTEDMDIEIEQREIGEVIELFKKENPGFCQIVFEEVDEEKAREKIYHYFYRFENHCLQSYHMNPMQRYQAQQALRVLKNLFSTRHEVITHFSVLNHLRKCFHGEVDNIHLGFAYEILFLFRALKGTNMLNELDDDLPVSNRPEWARFDNISQEVNVWMKRYPSGLDNEFIEWRKKKKELLINKFQITDNEWNDWEWQRKHVIQQLSELELYISLKEHERKAVQLANQHDIPFGMTPYYLSLLDVGEAEPNFDHFIRPQAFPHLKCVERTIEMQKNSQKKRTDRDLRMPPEIFITRG